MSLQRIASVSGWTPYDGKTVTGWPIHAIVRGHWTVREETLVSEPRGEVVRFLESR